MGIARDRTHRRMLALMQLLLFVFSTSTMLLPCASTSPKSHAAADTHASRTDHSVSHGAAQRGGHDHSDIVSQDVPTPPSHHAPGSPTSPDGCSWVIGCVGMMQFALDDSWRAVEHVPVGLAPVGVTLQRATADRDVESPPPRV